MKNYFGDDVKQKKSNKPKQKMRVISKMNSLWNDNKCEHKESEKNNKGTFSRCNI